MKLGSLLESSPPLGHKQELLAMQQALIDQGWDDVKVLPPVMVKGSARRYVLELTQGKHVIDLQGRVSIGVGIDDLTWYAKTGERASEDDDGELEPNGEGFETAVEQLKTLHFELQVQDALTDSFKIVRRETSGVNPNGFIIDYQIQPQDEDAHPTPHDENHAQVIFAEPGKEPELWWSSALWCFRFSNKIEKVQAKDIDALIELCAEKMDY